MNLQNFIQLFSIIFIIKCSYTSAQGLSGEIDPDYIECYWCNSRDIYCGKRVIDTMVTTIKCPKQSRCVVYTNPYDNYYLHRGCTYGMDLGDMEVENGCFVEEEGATYCFCDFNRCNAAGILDLRNLIDEKNYTTQRVKSDLLNDEEYFRGSIKKKISKSTNKPGFIPSAGPDTSMLPFRTSFNPLSNILTESNLNSINNSNTQTFDLTKKILSSLKENQNFLKKFQEYSGKIQASIRKSQLTTTPIPTTIAKTSTTTSKLHQPSSSKSFSPLDLLKQFNKLSTRVYTKPNYNRTTTASPKNFVNPSNNFPILYKLKINDSVSKNLLDNSFVRTKLGMKPNEKLNILIKRPQEPESSKKSFNQGYNLNELLELAQSYKQYPFLINNNQRKENFVTSTIPTTTSSTTLSWLSKLKAKLSQTFDPVFVSTVSPFQQFQQVKTTKSQEWNQVFSEDYKKGLKINFKCPRDGLFSHPHNCSQFLQCIDFGTVHERFYVLNCPAGLNFNQRLELCDYAQNVLCLQ